MSAAAAGCRAAARASAQMPVEIRFFIGQPPESRPPHGCGDRGDCLLQRSFRRATESSAAGRARLELASADRLRAPIMSLKCLLLLSTVAALPRGRTLQPA